MNLPPKFPSLFLDQEARKESVLPNFSGADLKAGRSLLKLLGSTPGLLGEGATEDHVTEPHELAPPRKVLLSLHGHQRLCPSCWGPCRAHAWIFLASAHPCVLLPSPHFADEESAVWSAARCADGLCSLPSDPRALCRHVLKTVLHKYGFPS